MQFHLGFFELYRRIIPWLVILSCLCITLASVWGLAFTPADSKQGEGFRILYLHVPAAVGSMLVYVFMALCAFVYLVWANTYVKYAMLTLAPIGAIYTLITLLSGSVWGSAMWGAWWVWDARLTSELLLFFLYLGTIALHHAYQERAHGGKAVALFVLVGVINLPIIHFSVEWWNTLHQPSTGFHQTLDPSMRIPLRLGIVGFILLSITLMLVGIRTRVEEDLLQQGLAAKRKKYARSNSEHQGGL